MNCKPGDLAILVNASPAKQHRLGSIVLVIEPYRGPLLGDWIIEHHGQRYRSIDANLRPIRPDGLTDQEVRELYAPKVPEVA